MSTQDRTRENRTFLDELDAAVAARHMLSHPFYRAWSAGELSVEILREYAKQYFAHVDAFPTYVSAVHSRCPDINVRKLLLHNLVEEEDGPDHHPELWLRFAEGLGLAREEVTGAELLPSTLASVAAMREIVTADDYRAGVAGLYAYESQIPAVSKTKREGLREFYGLDDARAVSFFSVHEEADVHHRREEREILASRCQTPEDQRVAVDAGGRAAAALWDFLSGVQAAYLG